MLRICIWGNAATVLRRGFRSIAVLGGGLDHAQAHCGPLSECPGKHLTTLALNLCYTAARIY